MSIDFPYFWWTNNKEKTAKNCVKKAKLNTSQNVIRHQIDQQLCIPGADLGGGCKGCAPTPEAPPPPEMTCDSLIQLVFCQQNVVYLALVMPFLSGAPPPKKDTGSTPVLACVAGV